MFKEQEGVIAPTDSRYRSDVRSLELGDLGKSVNLAIKWEEFGYFSILKSTEAATREKARLEEKQREARRNMKDEWRPRWFVADKDSNGHDVWRFTDKYWDRDYSDCPSLYWGFQCSS